MIISTTENIAGYFIKENLGTVIGNTIRARHVGKDIMASFRTIIGGEIKEYTGMMAESREQSMMRMKDKAKELGADAVVNYSEENITEAVLSLTDGSGVDAVVDHVGADAFPKAFSALRPGGRYGICGATTGLRTELHLGLLFSQQKEIYGVHMGTKEDMREIVEVLNKGMIHPAIDRTFPLAEAADAHRAMEETKFFGKLLLTV